MPSDDERARLSPALEPRLCPALMGQPIEGMGVDHVVLGIDAAWTGAPQWQIEGLRLKTDHEQRSRDPSNLRYGFVTPT